MSSQEPMGSSGLPESVRTFILKHLHSVEQLEVLLLLYRNSEKEWNADSVNAALKTNAASAEARLNDLYQRKLLSRRVDSRQFYYRCGDDPNARAVINQLGQFYKTHSVRIIELMYTRPGETILSFSNSFRLR